MLESNNVGQSIRRKQMLAREGDLISKDGWSPLAIKIWILGHRFQKFLIVGAIGLAVNQLMLVLLHQGMDFPLYIASPVAIFLSMVITFALNEKWTWHDRGRGPLVHRIMAYFPINMVGLLINFGVLTLLVNRFDVHYFIANLFGAGLAAIWNFALNNKVTWRHV